MTRRPQPSMRRRGLVVAAAAAIVGVALTGLAAAYWRSPGQGAGTAGTGTTTITATLTGVSGLYPGGSIAVAVAVNNTTTAASVTIVSLAQGGPTTIQTSGKGSCTPSVVAFTLGSLPAGMVNAGQSGTATGTVSMTGAALDGCQGATFSIPLTATARTS